MLEHIEIALCAASGSMSKRLRKDFCNDCKDEYSFCRPRSAANIKCLHTPSCAAEGGSFGGGLGLLCLAWNNPSDFGSSLGVLTPKKGTDPVTRDGESVCSAKLTTEISIGLTVWLNIFLLIE